MTNIDQPASNTLRDLLLAVLGAAAAERDAGADRSNADPERHGRSIRERPSDTNAEMAAVLKLYPAKMEVTTQRSTALMLIEELVGATRAEADARPSAEEVSKQRSSSGKATESRSGRAGIASSLLSVARVGFGLAPLLSGLIGVLGQEEDQPAVPDMRFRMPSPIRVNSAYNASTGTYDELGYAFDGTARAYTPQTAPAVTVNVQAMDSRSFLDHSDQIAQAVRQAMLNSHAINDTILDL